MALVEQADLEAGLLKHGGTGQAGYTGADNRKMRIEIQHAGLVSYEPLQEQDWPSASQAVPWVFPLTASLAATDYCRSAHATAGYIRAG